ncbi:hypothetical protein PVK06_040491 [Gossypium arboreum]|uniref:Uncharacterized protein n=1 Tax=Gossypium arboreum TaxID=29729 RepID=A0ABR0N5M1_GOSAR|nr:hypothetical protein PVK06_040491 [Gossypium arboreum]
MDKSYSKDNRLIFPKSTHRREVVIRSALGYQAFTVGTITGTPEMRPSRSSRTRERSSQCSNAHTGYGPNCLTTF